MRWRNTPKRHSKVPKMPWRLFLEIPPSPRFPCCLASQWWDDRHVASAPAIGLVHRPITPHNSSTYTQRNKQVFCIWYYVYDVYRRRIRVLYPTYIDDVFRRRIRRPSLFVSVSLLFSLKPRQRLWTKTYSHDIGCVVCGKRVQYPIDTHFNCGSSVSHHVMRRPCMFDRLRYLYLPVLSCGLFSCSLRWMSYCFLILKGHYTIFVVHGRWLCRKVAELSCGLFSCSLR